jgi:hypothetical protein
MNPIKVFSGNKPDYQPFRVNILCYSQTLDHPNNPASGLLGLILPQTEYDTVTKINTYVKSEISDDLTFILIQKPSRRPVYAQITTSNGDELTRHKIMVSEWDYANKLYLNQQEDIKLLKAAIIGSLSSSIQLSIGDPISGFLNMNPAEILHSLDLFYLKILASDFVEMKNKLLKPYVLSTDFEEFVTSQKLIHSLFDNVNQPICEVDKVTYFIKAINGEKLFDRIIEFFHFSTAKSVYFYTFASFVSHVRDNLGHIRLQNASSTILSKTTTTTAASASITKKEFKKWNPDEKKAKCIHYCWTHGPLSSHTSSACKKQATGHRAEATLDNPCGGRLVEWVKPK